MTGRHAAGRRLIAGRRRLVAVVALAPLALLVPTAHAGTTRTFSAPFRVGPTGGDSFSYHSASKDGSVTVGRVYPVPGVINCTKGGPYAKLLVTDRVSKPVRRVVVDYTSAAVDNFTFVMVGVRSGHRWFGNKTVRGFVAGSGSLTLNVPVHKQGSMPRTMTIEFGLQESSACPNADAGTVKFTRVRVVT